MSSDYIYEAKGEQLVEYSEISNKILDSVKGKSYSTIFSVMLNICVKLWIENEMDNTKETLLNVVESMHDAMELEMKREDVDGN